MNILVVEDEFIMREAFSRLFDWESYGFSLIGKAQNGEEALESIQNNEIDIVITDLKMPVMDGLTLIKETKKIKPMIKFVVMSAYDTFDLVSEAYKLGVKDYFLKFNMEPDKVLSMLARLKTEIEEEYKTAEKQMEQQETLKKMESHLNKNKRVLHEQQLKNLIWGGKDETTVQKQLADHGIHISQQKLKVMVLIFEGYYHVEKQNWLNERELFKFGILNVAEEILQSFEYVYVFCNLPNEYILLYSEEDVLYNIDFDVNLFYALKSSMETCFGFVVSGGLSGCSDGFSQSFSLYQQAKTAYEYSFIKGKGILIKYNEIANKSSDIFIDLDAKAEKFRDLIFKQRDLEKLYNSISEFAVRTETARTDDADSIQELFYTYYQEILSYIRKNNLSKDEKLSQQMERFINYLHKKGTLPELNDWLRQILEILSQEAAQNALVLNIKRYINQNYSRDISLNEVAQHMVMSESYLSRLFKRETGENFSEYLSKVRINKAIEMMQEGRYKVYEVAENVGYRNVEYFSKQFKKIIGKSPKDY